MSNPTSLKKIIQEKLSGLTIQVFEQFSKTKATDKIKKSLSKTSRKSSRTIHSLVKKAAKEQAKTEKKLLAKEKKMTATKKPKKVTVG
jgi:maltodextrin utilization protein YvdJ